MYLFSRRAKRWLSSLLRRIETSAWPAGGCEHVDFDTAAYSINVLAPAG
jgi:hypothetical protein